MASVSSRGAMGARHGDCLECVSRLRIQESSMQNSIRILVGLAFAVASVSVTACGRGKNEKSAAGSVAPPSSVQPNVPGTSYGVPAAGVDTANAMSKHHSKLKGAAAGAVAGHMVGHSAAGAVAGAVYQHERNKHKK
jgi:hypothetical protein